MDEEEKMLLFKLAACSAMTGLLAHDGEISEKKQKEVNKDSEAIVADKAVNYAEKLVDLVDEREKMIKRTGKWRK